MNKTIPLNIPTKFTIGHTAPEAASALFDFLRWQCGHDFDYKSKEQGYGGYKTTFKYKQPFQKKD
jgi:hypothetical protein